MNTFYFKEYQYKPKWLGFISPIFIALQSAISFFNWYENQKEMDLWRGLFFMVLAILFFLCWNRPKTCYITIADTYIEWLSAGTQTATKLHWSDVVRVKFEDDGASLYQQSSFCDFISFKNLNESDMEAIKKLIEATKL